VWDETSQSGTYTPDADFTGTDSFTYAVFDGQYTVEATSTIYVRPTNDAPLLAEIPDQTATTGTEWTYPAEGYDVDAESSLWYTLSGAPQGMSINASSGEVRWTPDATFAAGDYAFTVTVSDEFGASASATGTIMLDAKPVVSIATIDGYAWEGGPTTAAFVLRREGAIASELKVEYTLSGDAIEGDDYEDLTPHWVTFAAGQETAEIPLKIVALADVDNLEDYENVDIEVKGLQQYIIGKIADTILIANRIILEDPSPILERVQFKQLDGKQYHYKRDDKNNYGKWYEGEEQEQWYDLNRNGIIEQAKGEFQYPSAIVSGNKLAVSAKFYLRNQSQASKQVHIAAQVTSSDGSVNTVMTPQLGKLYTDPKNGTRYLKITFIQTQGKISGVKLIESININWLYYYNGSYHQAGASKNKLSVLYAIPRSEDMMYETVVEVGSKAGTGANSNNELLNRIWNVFAGLSIQNPRNDTLKYYGKWPDYNDPKTKYDGAVFKDLLSNADGWCQTWASFFYFTLRVQGYFNNLNAQGIISDSETFSVFRLAAKNTNNGLVVKTWSPAPNQGVTLVNTVNGTIGTIQDRTILNFIPYTLVPDKTNGTYNFVGTIAFNDMPGVAGQGQPNPPSLFPNHYVVRIGNSIYDPSYGKRTEGQNLISSIAIYETDSLNGYFIGRNFPIGTWSMLFSSTSADDLVGKNVAALL
jgi:hypothetical protein